MSATPGKVLVVGDAWVGGERVFVLQFLQGRDPEWVGRPFFARYDPQATWLTQLEPAFDESEFFFESELEGVRCAGRAPALVHRSARRRKPVRFGNVEWELE